MQHKVKVTKFLMWFNESYEQTRRHNFKSEDVAFQATILIMLKTLFIFRIPLLIRLSMLLPTIHTYQEEIGLYALIVVNWVT